MNSFIFNSENKGARFFIGTAVFFVLMVVAFNVYLVRKRPERQQSRNAWLENKIKAQKFVFDIDSVPAVIAGTSLTNALPQSFSDRALFNLGLSGFSPLTSVALLVREPKKIQVVYIETNVIDRDTGEPFLKEIFNPVTYRIAKMIPGFRAESRPITIAQPRLNASFRARMYQPRKKPVVKEPAGKKDPGVKPPVAVPPKSGVPSLFDKNLAIQLKNHSRIPPVWPSYRRHLRELVRGVESREMLPVFVELPVHPDIARSKQYTVMRKFIQENFPRDRYCFLRFDPRKYETSDSLHLTAPGARRVVNTLIRKADELRRMSVADRSRVRDWCRIPKS